MATPTAPVPAADEAGESAGFSSSNDPFCVTDCTADWRAMPEFDDHEQILACTDSASGLRAFIAIHSTVRGPSLGGCRMWAYADEREAVADVLRLAQGMSYKHAVAGVAQGGGKAVILGDPRSDKTPARLRAFGRFVQQLAGQYITAEDVGINVQDVVAIHSQTAHVAGLPQTLGGSGDPSPVTAYGVFCGIRAAVAFQRGGDIRNAGILRNVRVAVQGLGNVGFALCDYLHEAGARLIVSDLDKSRVAAAVEQFSATPVAPDSIFRAKADIFSPCALGRSLTPETVRGLSATIVAGAANNQLSSPEVAGYLHQRGILYAPDYVINAGGIINISREHAGYDRREALAQTERIAATLTEIFQRSAANATTTAAEADRMAQRRLKSGRCGSDACAC